MKKPKKSVARGRPPLSATMRAAERLRISGLAEDLFGANGFESVSMRRLADAAGCTTMTLYAYFENKADILREIWSRMLEDLFDELEVMAPGIQRPEPRLHAICARYVQYWLDHPERYRMVFMTPGVSQNDVGVFVASERAAARYNLFFDTLARCAANADPGHLRLRGETLICGLHGIAHNHVTISQYPWESAAEHVNCLVRALTKFD